MRSTYRDGERPEIPQDQLPDYQRASERLREVNFDAAQLVIALARMHADAEQCRRWCEKLQAAVLQMKLWIEACETMVDGELDPPRVRVEYVLVPSHECEARKSAANHRENEQGSTPKFEIDRTWRAELQVLMWLTRTAVDRQAESASAAPSEKVAQETLACLRALSRVLVRQQRHVAAMGVSPPECVYLIAKKCPDCAVDLSRSRWADLQDCKAKAHFTELQN